MSGVTDVSWVNVYKYTCQMEMREMETPNRFFGGFCYILSTCEGVEGWYREGEIGMYIYVQRCEVASGVG